MMRRTRSALAKTTEDQMDEPKRKVRKRVAFKDDSSSSSESDIENYLKPASEIDLNSSFFKHQNPKESFEQIEKTILEGVNTSNNVNSENCDTDAIEQTSFDFQQINDYMKQMEDTKKLVSQYEAKRIKETEQETINIADLLITGENKTSPEKLNFDDEQYNSSDFESLSENDDWEEVKEAKEKEIIPSKGVEITLQLSNEIRKKKGVDLMAAMKRRLNRVRKETQVLMHKVHLLCWIAHGNFVNGVLNSPDILALSLSLLPSEQCYPPERADLSYLEQFLQWYRKTIQNVEKKDDISVPLDKKLQMQISKKEAYSKRMLVLIFVCILRSLGIQCRVVMSLQVLPLRPPSSELCSLSTKVDNNEKVKGDKTEIKTNQDKTEENSSKTSNKISKEKNHKIKSKRKSSSKEDNKNCEEKVRSSEKTAVSKKRNEVSTSPVKGTSGKEKVVVSKSTSKEKQRDKQKSSSQESLPKKDKTQKDKTKVESKSSDAKSNISTVTATTEKSRPETKKPKLSRIKDKELKVKPRTSPRNLVKEPTVPQLDGANDSDDNASSSSTTTKSKPKLNLKALKETKLPDCPIRNHTRRLKSAPSYTEANSDDDFETSGSTKPNLKHLMSKSKKKTEVTRSRSVSSLNNNRSPKKPLDVRNDIINLLKGRMVEQKYIDQSRKVKSKRTSKKIDSDDDSDYFPEPLKKKQVTSDDEFVQKPKVKKRVQVKKEENNKVLSSDSDADTRRKGIDVWVEVFLEAEEKWISVDVIRKQIHCVNEIYSRASHPVSYIIAWNNNNTLKDVTKRYCTNWGTVTRKLRVDSKWWEQTLKPFEGKKTARDKEEDEELTRQQLEKPLPTTISEYKNHPLYVLKRHLLKFEAIYPPDAVTLGFVRNEPVYSRDCVYTLHSRDIWLKHAKVVKPGEKPYKIVKARPKYDKLSNTVISDQPLEIFGVWQVQDYVPPVAENGVVPRNAYGNVELFKDCMLPVGTVHLKLPGLNKVAKKLNVDCAPALVGFDFHSGWSHPTYDGYVVCKEFEEALVAAWHEEQEIAEQREREKLEKRVYDNWKRLIKGLLIRERLKAKYDFGEPSTSGGKCKRKGKAATLVVKKKRRICSDSESDSK